MFWPIVERVRRDLEDLQNVVDTNERLKAHIFSPAAENDAELRSIRLTSPTRSAWALYDHSAAVTRLYAILEDYIDSIIKEYLEALPDIYPKYLDLPLPIINQHRLGVAQILSKLGDKGLYRHLSERATLEGISEGNLGRQYSLLPDAFLTDTQNYRADQINAAFAYLAITNIWAGVEKHREVVEYMRSRDANETPRTILHKLVEDRNFASHSIVTDVLSGPELISLARFLTAVTISIAEIARKNCVTLECSAGRRVEMFHVLHIYSNNVVGVRFLNGAVRVGDELLVLGGDGAYKAIVASINRFDVPLESADADTCAELGLGLDVVVRKNARLVSFRKLGRVAP